MTLSTFTKGDQVVRADESLRGFMTARGYTDATDAAATTTAPPSTDTTSATTPPATQPDPAAAGNTPQETA